MNSRPFGQSRYPRAKLRLGPSELVGPVYKFRLLLPILKDGSPRFSKDDQSALEILLTDDFGGFTSQSNVTNPILSGGYTTKQGIRMVDQHAAYEVYTRLTDESISYFEELARNLEEYSRTILTARLRRYRGEEKILIELSTVRLL